MEVGGNSSVTAVDVAEHPVVGPLAADRGELTGLALWLIAERRQVSPASLPRAVASCQCPLRRLHVVLCSSPTRSSHADVRTQHARQVLHCTES